MAALATRYVSSRWISGNATTKGGAASIFGGCSSVEELETNARSIEKATALDDVTGRRYGRAAVMEEDQRLVEGARAILGDWIDFAWESPQKGWERDGE
jgi:hypothetical protein